MANHAPSPPEAIDLDLPCSNCNYDLRGLANDGACPECGQAIVTSIAHAKHSDGRTGRRWLIKMRWGAALLLITGVATQLPQMVNAFFGNYGRTTLILLYLSPIPVATVAAWLLTTRRPGERRTLSSSGITRGCLIAWIAFFTFTFLHEVLLPGDWIDRIPLFLVYLPHHLQLALPAVISLALYWRLSRIAIDARWRILGWLTRLLAFLFVIAVVLPVLPDDIGAPKDWFIDSVPGIGCRGWALVLLRQLILPDGSDDPFEIMDTDGYYHVPAVLCPIFAVSLLLVLNILFWIWRTPPRLAHFSDTRLTPK